MEVREHGVLGGTRQVDDQARQLGDEAHLDHAADENEEADEEENRRPFHFREDLVGVEAGEEQEHRGPQKGDGRRLDMGPAMGGKAEDDEDQHADGFLHQARIPDQPGLVHGKDMLPPGLVDHQALAEEHPGDGHQRPQHDHHRRPQIGDEIHEPELGAGGDDEVRRIADQGRRAADVGSQGLHDEKGDGVDLELVGDEERHRGKEQDGGDVVQQGGEDRRKEQKEHHYGEGSAVASLASLTADHSKMPLLPKILMMTIMPMSRKITP